MSSSPDVLPTLVFWIVMLCWILFAVAFLLRRRSPPAEEKKRNNTTTFGLALEAAGYAIVWMFRRPISTVISPLPYTSGCSG